MHKRVCVVGCGYVGLTTGLYLSDQYATSVVFVEKDPHSLSSLGAGTLPIAEPGLSEIFKKNRSNLTFHSSIPSDQLPFDAIYVCVGTPSTVEGISLDQMCSAAADIQSFLQISSSKEIMVVIRSTIVPGSTREIFEKLETDLTSDHSVKVIYNPEFLREGSALKDIRGEGRNLYGTNKGDRCLTFENLLKNPIATTWETAEFSKYYSNIFYVSLMAYSNEMAFIAESLPYEIDMKTVVKQHILDKRITKAASGGSNDLETTGFETYLPPSFGYGGSCFPKDVKAGEQILLDDGKLIFEILETDLKTLVKAKVIQGGALKSKKGVNLPNTKISLPALTPKDIEDAAFAIKHNFDWIALSFVRNSKDLLDLKKIKIFSDNSLYRKCNK